MLIIAYHIIITVLIHTTSIALHKWSRIRISFEDVQQAFEARAATTPAGVQVLSSSNTGAGARTCTAAGLYNSSPSDCSPFSSSVNGSGCPSRRRCVKGVACSPEQLLDLDTYLLMNTSKFVACKSRHLHSGLGENECSEVGWSVVGCSGVACAVRWMPHESEEWLQRFPKYV